ncbi:MAG: spore coat protein [Candidatus Buchananbacteria bacterium CG10_big_fil_rev_8_21_14_0_10_42_9]|uniref:Spore coat protein n=1 Tax=Candidatus Buchananbacteria bacterium CG10_big_fil_rev_8_21_14_0_10_42_9 TaxID=1974526 RepID=A0A2H0W1S5_9BACT|nr:MAG: spore coat protein [Candidatus Buchananbacteria bacterium CG10_big_fil_rev_8_21_14_0_10_42_9]
MKNKVLCIIQARMGSTRLPGKVLKQVNGMPLLEYEISRLGRSTLVDRVVVATTTDPSDDKVEALCKKLEVDCFRGSNEDVLERYYQCALSYPEYQTIVRVTGDCPLIDPAVIDKVIQAFNQSQVDYAANIIKETFPDGMDVEVFTLDALTRAAKEAKLQSEREHVTLFIRNNDFFKKYNLAATKNYSSYRLTVDNPEDFEVIEFLIKHTDVNATYNDFIRLLDENPEVKLKNTNIKRNEGLAKSLASDKLIK